MAYKRGRNNGCTMVAKILKKPNNPWNNWNLYTRYSTIRKSVLLNIALIIEFEQQTNRRKCLQNRHFRRRFMPFESKTVLIISASVILRVITEGFYDIVRGSLSIFAVSYVFDVIAGIDVHKDIESLWSKIFILEVQ